MAHSTGYLTRRGFVSRAAAAAMAGAAGGLQKAYAAQSYDMIIIGGGTAGIPCAINAAEAGAKVLLIEKSAQLGGTLWLAGGSMAAAGTRVQARKGIKDSPDLHYADVMALAHNKANPDVVRRYVDNAGPMADWLDDLGFQVREGEPVATRGGHASFTVARYFQGTDRGRSLLRTLLPVLRRQVEAGRVRLLLSTDAAELVLGRDRSVRGVIAASEGGTRTQFEARKVVITTGGYCSGPEVFKKVTGYPLYSRSAYFMSKGEGLLLGEAAGGFVRGGEYQVLGPGGVLNDRDYPSVFVFQPELDHKRRPQWEIRVNTLGQRFVREDHPDQDLRDDLFTKQPTARMWVVFDQEIANKAPSILRGKDKAVVDALYGAHPMFFREPTLEALAERTGVDAANLRRTVEDYNAGVRNQRDSLGREFLPAEIAKAPFFALEISGGNIVGAGGLAVDADMRVLRQDGGLVKNLYAAGEVIGLATVAGDTVVQGSGVTPSLTFGRLIGKAAMQRA